MRSQFGHHLHIKLKNDQQLYLDHHWDIALSIYAKDIAWPQRILEIILMFKRNANASLTTLSRLNVQSDFISVHAIF